uniref:Cyclic nucleotide-binding/CBS domain-containing protein n=1 Tax=Thermorudis peleae TaxID=1382356 RepID=A0A831THL0_9BACT
MDNVVLDSTVAFLQRIPPFQFLPEPTLRRVAAQAEIHYFPKGTALIRRGGAPAEYLYVIQRGGVKKSVRSEDGEETVVEIAGEGDLVGVLSAVDHTAGHLDDIALEDTVCYAIPRAVVDELMATEPAFTRYLLHALQQALDVSLEALRQRAALWESDGSFLLAARCRDIARSPVLTCSPATPIQEAARRMTEHRVNSIVVVDEAGHGSGIVTDWDLRERVVAAGLDYLQPVSQIMSSPLVTVAGDEPVAEAIRLMIARNIHHLVVVDGARPIGMITGYDLVVRQGTSPVFIAKAIDRASDPKAMRSLLEQVQRQLFPFLLARGVRATQLGYIAAEINDRIIARLLALLEAELGPHPVPYCWLVLGSEGRREQTIKTDQDNALLYADPPEGEEDAARDYFLELGRRAVEGLVAVGFPPCSGRYTADNPEWVQPLARWRRRFEAWVAVPEPEDVLSSLIFFDFRGVHGDLALADQLRRYITELMPQSGLFLVHVAGISTAQGPPLGFLGQFVVERSGEHKDQLDLKHGGTGAIVNLVRLFALRHGVEETSTLSRLERLKAAGQMQDELANDLAEAFEFLLSLRFRQQWEDLRAGKPISNFIDPRQLSSLERRLLKESFKIIGRAQAVVRQEFSVEHGMA